MSKQENESPKFIVVGVTKEGAIMPITPFTTTKIYTGDIVYSPSDTGAEWHRVYEDGRKGLRFWCVTALFKAALEEYQATETKLVVDRLRREYANTIDKTTLYWLDEQESINDDWHGYVDQEPPFDGWHDGY